MISRPHENPIKYTRWLRSRANQLLREDKRATDADELVWLLYKADYQQRWCDGIEETYTAINPIIEEISAETWQKHNEGKHTTGDA